MDRAPDAPVGPVVSRSSGRARAVLALTALLLVLAVGYGVRESRQLREDDARTDDRAAALRAASAEVEALITVSAGSSKADLQRLLDGATREFRKDLQAQAATFRSALRSGGVTATGEVTSAGVVKLDGDRARLLVAAQGTVANDRTDGAEPRQYRVRVDVERVGGRWLVSRLEFVA